MKTSTVLTTLAATLALPAGATTTLSPDLTVQVQDPCRAEVSKFERAIGFIRHNQGNQAATELKEKLLPARLENEILMKDGYCGLAKYIRDRKLDR